MNYALYQGNIYEVAEIIYNSNGLPTAVRLETQSGVTVPIPYSDVTFVSAPTLGTPTTGNPGSSGSGTVVFSDSAPANPQPGQVWRNTSGSTVSGVPSGSFAVWNGTAWVPVGAGQPSSSVISSATAPTAPTPGQVWLNTSGGTVAGVPSGNFAVWNGTAWVPVGTYQPSSSTASAAATVTLTGDVTGTGTGTIATDIANSGVVAGVYGSATELVGITIGADGRITAAQEFALPPAAGGGVTEIDVNGSGNLVGNINVQGAGVVLSGQNINFDAYATDAELTAAISAHVAASDPHAQYTTTLEVYGSRYLAQATAPSSPQVGDVWRNTAGTTVNGIPSGNYAVWSGVVWSNRGTQYPFLSLAQPAQIQPGANNTVLQTNDSGVVVWAPLAPAQIPDIVQNPGFVIQSATDITYSPNVWTPVNPGTAVVDKVGGYNGVNGTYTIPAGYPLAVWELSTSWTNTIAPPNTLFSGATINNATLSSIDSVIASGSLMCSGVKTVTLNAGDVIRWFTLPLIAQSFINENPGFQYTVENFVTSGTLVYLL